MEYSQNEVKINLAHECLGLARRFMDAYVEKRYADIPYTIKYGKYIPGVTCSARCLTRMKEIEIFRDVPDVAAHEFMHAADNELHPSWFTTGPAAARERYRSSTEAYRECGRNVGAMRPYQQCDMLSYYFLDPCEVRAFVFAAIYTGEKGQYLSDIESIYSRFSSISGYFEPVVEDYTIDVVKARCEAVLAFLRAFSWEAAETLFKYLENDPVFLKYGV